MIRHRHALAEDKKGFGRSTIPQQAGGHHLRCLFNMTFNKKVWQKQYRDKRRQWLREIKSKAVCKNCGESDPRCLDFHHREPEHKLFNISKAVIQTWSWKKVLDEIAKCDILCANCHRKCH